MKIAGLDIGTTGCKCTVFDEKGAYLGKAYRDYPVRRSVGGHEMDVSAIMEGVFGVLREMAGQYPDIAGIGVTSCGETFVMTDGEGKPLHTAMLYTDPRGARQCARLREKIGEYVREYVGKGWIIYIGRNHRKSFHIGKHSVEVSRPSVVCTACSNDVVIR